MLLWWLNGDRALRTEARNAIADPKNTVFLSAIVVWEIRIKEALGKLSIPGDFREALAAESFSPLAVRLDHAHAVGDLPAIHRDPFDRLLVAQAMIEKMTIVTADSTISRYAVKTL